MKQTLRFDQISCRLQVEGLPDVSAGQGSDAIGIVTGWNLQWAGRPELEGKKEHLQALMQAVLPYARLLLSDAPRLQHSLDQSVQVTPAGPGVHRLTLRSSQPDTPALEVSLDDAELADLVRVLDQLRLEPRLQLQLELPAAQPLRGRQLQARIPKRQRLAAPVAALLVLGVSTAASLLLPAPKLVNVEATTSKPTPRR
ncbi:MAG: DUF4335 domain-containing protein [Cyanobacteria bacterium K_DeepCast_35m_m2_155]|nr:DUF4335 domain-containing protein [Cyanobacteria bacterium K_DeepCast_35m_m2_155]